MTLSDKTLALADSIVERWEEQPEMDLVSFQRRYLYIQALGATHTARAYWILHNAQQYYECHILARNLLERIFNSRIARKSPTLAGELMASELEDYIRRLRTWQRDEPNLPAADMTDLLARNEKDLKHFLDLLGEAKAPRWDDCRKAREADMLWAYLSLYSHFSLYTHAKYAVSRPVNLNIPSDIADFIALLAPINTALQLHRLSCADNPCKVAVEYKALHDEILKETHGEPISAEA